jgi:hypothetical protein
MTLQAMPNGVKFVVCRRNYSAEIEAMPLQYDTLVADIGSEVQELQRAAAPVPQLQQA